MRKFYYIVALLCLFLLVNNGSDGGDSVKHSIKKDATAQQTSKSKTFALANAVPNRDAIPTIGGKVNLQNAPTATPTEAPTPTPTPDPEPSDSDPIHLGQYLASTQYGWTNYEWTCLYQLWQRESGWSPYSVNPSSGAFGIVQALPKEKIIADGFDYTAKGQILWGLQYIKNRYNDPITAWDHETNYNWY